jgi:hypothetical protein
MSQTFFVMLSPWGRDGIASKELLIPAMTPIRYLTMPALSLPDRVNFLPISPHLWKTERMGCIV